MNGHSMGRGEKEEHAMVPKAGWGEKSGGWDDGDGSGDEEGCGVGSCRPGFLKRFSHIALFSILMGAASMYVDVMMSYLGTQFIWLERLYGLTPGQTKMLLVWGKIGFLVLVPFLSVMARRWHMPRTLAITAVIVALAAIICVMPYPVHKSDLYAPPNVTKQTQFTMFKLQMQAPSCVMNKEMSGEFSKLMQPTDENCNPIVPEQPAKSQRKTPENENKESPEDPVGGGNVSNTSATGNNTRDTADTGADSSPVGPAVDTKPEPEKPVPTVMVPDFQKLQTHPLYDTIKQMAAANKVDLDKLAAMNREQQLEAMKQMPPEVAKQMPLLKQFLGENADSYFYSVPASSSRKRRQADGASAEATSPGNTTRGEPSEPSVVKPTEPAKEELSKEDKMLNQLKGDMMWNGALATMVRTQLASLFSNPCTQKKIKEMVASMCPYNIGPLLEDKDGAATAFVALISLGMVVAGLAKAAHPAFSAIYIDSRSTEMKSGIYFGILFGLAHLSSVVSQLLGFNASVNYLTLEDVGLMGFLNPRWVGAWWSGFLLVIIGSFLAGLLLFFFPNPNDRLVKQARERKFSKTAKGFLQSGMRLLGNPIFLLITIANALTVMACQGMLQYLPKYVENEFYLSPMGPGILLGIVIPLIMAIGIFGGGIISSVAKLSPFNCLKLVTGCALTVFVLQAALLGLGCDQIELNKGDMLVNLTNGEQLQCSQTCVCMDFIPMPACGSDGVSYLTPCHAGCGFPIEEDNSFKWHHCKCIGDEVQTARPGLCEQDCQGGMFMGFSFILGVACFIVAIKAVPAFMAMFRSVEKQDAPLAIGINAFFVCLVGVIPSTMIYHSVFNGVCLMERPDCGPVDVCAIYDVEALRMRFNGVGTGIKAAAALFYVIAMVLGFRENSVYNRGIHEDTRRK